MHSSILLNITNLIFQFHSKLSYSYLKYLFNTSGATSSFFLSVYQLSSSLTFPLRHFFLFYPSISFTPLLSQRFIKNPGKNICSPYHYLSFPYFKTFLHQKGQTIKIFSSSSQPFFSFLPSRLHTSSPHKIFISSLFNF